jgi:uncharacterized protein (DUF1778 family)
MNAAYQSVMETIAAHERTTLQPRDYPKFLTTLDMPPEPTELLRMAFTRHRETIVSW